MNTSNFASLNTLGMQDLNSLFDSFQKPYGKGEIVRFNLAYQRLYPKLTRAERQRAENLVDAMLDNLEDERLAPKIYGVV